MFSSLLTAELLTLDFSWHLFEFCCTLFGGSLLISVKFFTVTRNSCFFAVGNKKENDVCMNEVYENRAFDQQYNTLVQVLQSGGVNEQTLDSSESDMFIPTGPKRHA